MTKIGIVGYGVVGRHLHNKIRSANQKDVLVFVNDPILQSKSVTKEEINKCDIVFVCVPTPSNKDGSCDTTIVESVIKWVKTPVIVIRSTVEVGSTKKFCKKYKKRIVFQPEFLGETTGHPMNKDTSHIILGGERKDTSVVLEFYKKLYTAQTKFMQTDSKTAELLKYMRNDYLAMVVTFCNEIYDIAQAHKIDYNELRELFILDPRINPSHTLVYPDNRGYGGKCFPKDVKALIKIGEDKMCDVTLLKAVHKKNMELTK